MPTLLDRSVKQLGREEPILSSINDVTRAFRANNETLHRQRDLNAGPWPETDEAYRMLLGEDYKDLERDEKHKRIINTILFKILDRVKNIDKVDASIYHGDKILVDVPGWPNGVIPYYSTTAQVLECNRGLFLDELRQLRVQDKCTIIIRCAAVNEKCEKTDEPLLVTTSGCVITLFQRGIDAWAQTLTGILVRALTQLLDIGAAEDVFLHRNDFPDCITDPDALCDKDSDGRVCTGYWTCVILAASPSSQMRSLTINNADTITRVVLTFALMRAYPEWHFCTLEGMQSRTLRDQPDPRYLLTTLWNCFRHELSETVQTRLAWAYNENEDCSPEHAREGTARSFFMKRPKQEQDSAVDACIEGVDFGWNDPWIFL